MKLTSGLTKKLCSLADVPAYVPERLPSIFVEGFDRVTVEQQTGLLEYSDVCIRIRVRCGTVQVTGSGLGISRMKDHSITVTGRVDGCRLEREERP